MFLNIQKIGKTKHKYKGKITFVKMVNQATQKGVCFKIKLQRGSNQVQAISQPSRKGASKFKNEQYVVPMTMFFKEEQSKYLPKQMTLKAYQSDQEGKEIRKIGSTQLNLSQYVNQGKLKLQVQLEPQKSKDSPVLTLQIHLERQDDDSKSVGTTSNNSDIRRKLQDLDNEKQKAKQKVQRNGYKTSQQSKPKRGLAVKKEYETQLSANQSSQSRGGMNNIMPITLTRKQDDRKKSADYASNSQKYEFNILSAPLNKKYPTSEQEMKRSKTVRNEKQQKIKPKNEVIQQVQEMEASIKKKISSKNNPQTQFTEGESPQLQIFLLKKALKQKQKDINNLNRQNQSLKKTIDKLVQESSSTKERQKQTGINKEVEELKKSLLSKDIIIDQLTSTNKTLSSRQQQYQKTILKLRQELALTKQKITEMKYKEAFFMQQLFETANKEALQQACRFLSI